MLELTYLGVRDPTSRHVGEPRWRGALNLLLVLTGRSHYSALLGGLAQHKYLIDRNDVFIASSLQI